MAGYQCVFHDGPADATHIHQTLGQPGVISVCGECQPMYFITGLAQSLGVDAGGLYEVVRAHQIAVQQLGEPPAPPDVAEPPHQPVGPHPAGPVTGNLADGWDWCNCDAPGPHHADGSPIDFEAIAQLREDPCPYCDAMIRDIVSDDHKALALHIEGHHAEELSEQAGDQS